MSIRPTINRPNLVVRGVNQPDPPQSSDPNQTDASRAQPWLKFAGLGMELAGSTLGLAAIGYLIDRYRGKDDGYGVAAGALIGFSFGMFRLIQKAMREVHEQSN